MAKEYIEREAAKERLRVWITDCVLAGENDEADCFRDCIDLLDSIPAADVAPVVHGRWIWHERYFEYECSACKCRFDFNNTYGIFDHTFENGDYCPNCGAKMDEEPKK